MLIHLKGAKLFIKNKKTVFYIKLEFFIFNNILDFFVSFYWSKAK